MAKYRVVGLLHASIVVGEYEAENADDAIAAANADENANWMPCLCHHCSGKIDTGDVCDVEAELA